MKTVQTNKEYNQEDLFSKKIKQKLENQAFPLDEDCWKKIEQKIPSKTVSNRSRIRSSIAAAAALVLILISPLLKKESKINPNNDSKQITIQKEQNKALDSLPQNNLKSSYKTQTISYTKVKSLQTPNQEPDFISNSSENIPDSISHTICETSTESIFRFKRDSVLKHTLIQPDKTPSSKNQQKQLAYTHQDWSGTFGIGTHGSTSILDQNNANRFDEYGLTNTFPAEDITNQNNFNNIHYLPSLSMGVKIRKNITQKIGIESGIIYTYLHSTFELNNLDILKSKSKLSLHYIGIPIQLIYSPWVSKQWNFYLTAGGMLEKGVHFLQTFENPSIQKEKGFIHGYQWSTLASFGISYSFNPHMGIFIEPHMSYFFKADQPISIRTEKPLNVGFTLGFRTGF